MDNIFSMFWRNKMANKFRIKFILIQKQTLQIKKISSSIQVIKIIIDKNYMISKQIKKIIISKINKIAKISKIVLKIITNKKLVAN